MRFDLVTIFPEFFAPLSISLLGKAANKGILSYKVHNLRDHTKDPHRTVDAPPYGGGPGMVMRADIWGKAIDSVLEQGKKAQCNKPVLAIPTPAGCPFTQARAQWLTEYDQIIVACGRYEGIDARIAQHYQNQGIEVFEFSLGDYVLNGGEVAALALVEAVGRLEPEVVGNADSLVEESHCQLGLLEYPVFTRPVSWRGIDVPEVLRGGNHDAISVWREVAGVMRTVQVRPDLINSLDFEALNSVCREALALGGGKDIFSLQGHFDKTNVKDRALVDINQVVGWVQNTQSGKTNAEHAENDQETCADSQLGEEKRKNNKQRVRYRYATAKDAHKLSELATQTFPLACPEYIRQQDIDNFMRTNFCVKQLEKDLEKDNNVFILAQIGTVAVGYTWLIKKLSPLESEQTAAPPGVAYLSKCYTLPEYHGSGLAGALLRLSAQEASQSGATEFWVGTNQSNKRAIRFYRKHGFKKSGIRYFKVGTTIARDILLRTTL